MKKSLIIAFVLSLAGLYVAIELTEFAISMTVDGTAECRGGSDGCKDAFNSDYSKLFGIPISIFGTSFYLAGALMLLLSTFWKSEEANIIRTLFIGSTLSSIASIFLAIVSIRGGYLCPLCATLYGINFALFAATFVALPNRSEEGLRGAMAAPTSIAFWVTALLVVLVVPTERYRYVTTVNVAKNAKNAAEAARIVEKNKAAKAAAAAQAKAAASAETKKDAQKAEQPNANENAAAEVPAPIAFETKERPVRGPKDTPLTLIEFSDFECPYCQKFGQSLKTALKTAPGKFNYVFKHFPLDRKCNPSIEGDFHKFSCEAAYAMICAGREGKEWQMHDLIFDNQRALKATSFTLFAQELGLSLSTFKSCMKAPETKSIVTADIMEGLKAGIQGTPAVFVNGIQMNPELDGERLGKLLGTISDQMR